MGKYITTVNGVSLGTTFKEKCENLLKVGATETTPNEFKENLICVVDNKVYGAVGYAYSDAERIYFRAPDGRPRKWFTLPDAEKWVDKK